MSLYSLEAEQSVIGAALLNGKVIDSLADIVRPGDFHDIANATIWGAILELACRQGRKVDLVTLGEYLENDDTLYDLGGFAYLSAIAQNTPTTSNAEDYARIVSDKAKRRALRATLVDLMNEAEGTKGAFSDLIDSAQGRLLALVNGEQEGASTVQESLRTMLDTIDRRYSGDESPMGASFGLQDLDNLTMGMGPGDLVVVGARPSMGKTAFALNILRAVTTRDRLPAIIFSMEMSREAITTRLTAAASNLELDKLRDPKRMEDADWPKLTAGVAMLKEANLVIDDRPALTASQIRGAAKRWKERFGTLGVVVVDYLGLMKAEDRHGTREQEVAAASRAMKALAKELKCPVVLLSQLNRALEQRELNNRRPRMSDLRESGAIEQDADLIIFLYRHEVYDPDNQAMKGVAEAIVGKQREGRLGTAYSAAMLDRGQFNDLAASKIHELRNPPLPPMRAKKSAMAEF